MRFLIDECVGPAVADWLRQQGYEIFSVFDNDRYLTKIAVIRSLLDHYSEHLVDNYLVATEQRVRFAKQ